MDYGKMAYLKAEELEARISTSARRQSQRFFRARPFQTFNDKKTLLSYSGGAFAVIVTVCINSQGGRAYLAVGGLRAAENEFAPGRTERTFMAASAGTGRLTLINDTLKNAVLERYEVLFVGDEPDVSEDGGSCALARSGADYALATAADCDVDVVKCDSRFVKSVTLKAGRGEYADVCACGDGFYIVYGDVYGVLWGVAADSGLNVLSRNFLGENVGKLSVAAYEDFIAVAFVQDGRAKYFTTAFPNGVRSDVLDVEFNGTVQGVKLVKGAAAPALLIESSGKVFLLKAQEEKRGKDTFAVRVRGYLESV